MVIVIKHNGYPFRNNENAVLLATGITHHIVLLGVVRRNPRNFRQPSSSPATSASRSMNLPSVWKV